MAKFRMKIEYETYLEGEDEDNALEGFFEALEMQNETIGSFFHDLMVIEEVNELKEAVMEAKDGI